MVLLKVDYRNSCNSVRCDCFLWVMREKFPCLFPFVWLAYCTPSHLFSEIPSFHLPLECNKGTLWVSSINFSLAIHSLASELVSAFNVWYLDDGTLGGSPQSVLADFTTIIGRSSSLGLSLNLSKCELYMASASSSHFVNELQSVAPGVRLLDSLKVTLLGFPFTLDALPSSFESKLCTIQILHQS